MKKPHLFKWPPDVRPRTVGYGSSGHPACQPAGSASISTLRTPGRYTQGRRPRVLQSRQDQQQTGPAGVHTTMENNTRATPIQAIPSSFQQTAGAGAGRAAKPQAEEPEWRLKKALRQARRCQVRGCAVAAHSRSPTAPPPSRWCGASNRPSAGSATPGDSVGRAKSSRRRD